jgi:hypothetical protein
MRMTSSSVPVTIEGGTLRWQGDVGRVQDIEIRFERPLVQKLWTRTWDFLTSPVFKI